MSQYDSLFDEFFWDLNYDRLEPLEYGDDQELECETIPCSDYDMMALMSVPTHHVSHQPNIVDVLNDFCYLRALKEAERYGVSRVPDFDSLNMIFGCFSVDQVCHMSRTTLWRLHCVYGRKIQKMVCHRLNVPLPSVPQRKQSRPMKKGGKCGSGVKTTKSHSNNSGSTTNEMQRTSPKNQVAVHEFCIDILLDPFYSKSRRLLEWIREEELIFRIGDMNGLSKLWAKVKDNSKDSPDNFSRAIRFSRSKSKFFHLMEPQSKKSRQFTKKAFDNYREKKEQFKVESENLH